MYTFVDTRTLIVLKNNFQEALEYTKIRQYCTIKGPSSLLMGNSCSSLGLIHMLS